MSEDILDQIDAALANSSRCLCGCTTALTAASPSPWFASEECQARWGARQLRNKSGSEKEAERVEAAADRGVVQQLAANRRCWRCGRSFVVLAGETCDDCVPPSAVPAPGRDRVHDAFRAEVIRQGLSEYWVDGVRYVVAPTAASGYRTCKERLAPPVDAALEPAPDARSWWRRMLPGGNR
jgi:hypothetical protein